MSGGSFNYKYQELDEYIGHTHDSELDGLLIDLRNVLHDLEWWQSCDYSEDQYRTSLKKFKKKWLAGYGDENEKRIERFKKNLLIGINDLLSRI